MAQIKLKKGSRFKLSVYYNLYCLKEALKLHDEQILIDQVESEELAFECSNMTYDDFRSGIRYCVLYALHLLTGDYQEYLLRSEYHLARQCFLHIKAVIYWL